jgi:hypothetical protein
MTDLIQQLFRRLGEGEFEITSQRDSRYNCVAWAAGDVRRWWWPIDSPFVFWPPKAKREESISSFIDAFGTLGYEPSDSGSHEAGVEKVAIFASSEQVPTHVARQLADGSWTSKLGRLEDIAHIDVNGVGGTDYGEIVAFLRRRRATSDVHHQ